MDILHGWWHGIKTYNKENTFPFCNPKTFNFKIIYQLPQSDLNLFFFRIKMEKLQKYTIPTRFEMHTHFHMYQNAKMLCTNPLHNLVGVYALLLWWTQLIHFHAQNSYVSQNQHYMTILKSWKLEKAYNIHELSSFRLTRV